MTPVLYPEPPPPGRGGAFPNIELQPVPPWGWGKLGTYLAGGGPRIELVCVCCNGTIQVHHQFTTGYVRCKTHIGIKIYGIAIVCKWTLGARKYDVDYAKFWGSTEKETNKSYHRQFIVLMCVSFEQRSLLHLRYSFEEP